MNRNLVLIISLAALASLAAKAQDEIGLQTLTTQIEEGSGGLVSAQSPIVNGMDYHNLRKTIFGTWTFLGDQKKAHKANQVLFKLDLDKFMQKYDAATFTEAKRRYYSQIDFNLSNYSYEHKYPTLEEWKNLNHPPIRTLEMPMEKYVEFMHADRKASPDESPYYTTEFHNQVDKYSQTELTQGNVLTVFTNGDSPAEKTRLALQAKKYIFAAVMAFSCTPETEPLVSALEQKVKEGLDVRIIIEKFFGNVIFRKCYKRLKRSGIKVMKLSDKAFNRFAFMHNKFWIFGSDDKHDTGMIGGQNIARFQTLSDGFNHYNRDTDLRVVGPTSTDLLENFHDLWNGHQRKFLSNSRHYPDMEAYLPLIKEKKARELTERLRGKQFYKDWLASDKRNQGVCRLAVQRPLGKNFHVAEVFAMYTRAAQKSIQATTPDMTFDLPGAKKIKTPNANKLYNEFIGAAQKGVLVDFISNGRDGGWGEMTAQFRDWSEEARELGKEGKARFWEKRQQNQTIRMIKGTREGLKHLGSFPNFNTYTHSQYIHAKQLMWDRQVVSIGSVNLDVTALERNHEGTLICMDENLVMQMEKVFTSDLINATPVKSRNGL